MRHMLSQIVACPVYRIPGPWHTGYLLSDSALSGRSLSQASCEAQGGSGEFQGFFWDWLVTDR